MSPEAAFEDAVVRAVQAIPAGEVMTYGEVAAEAGRPRAARAVGNILAVTAEPVPWWRVVGAGLRLVSPSSNEQRSMLMAEGWLVEGRKLRQSGREGTGEATR